MALDTRYSKKRTSKSPAKGEDKWWAVNPTHAERKLFEKAVIRYMIAKGITVKTLEANSKTALKVVPFLRELNSDWKEVTKNNWDRNAHAHHKALYNLLYKFQRTPPKDDVIEAERILWKGPTPTPQKPADPKEDDHDDQPNSMKTPERKSDTSHTESDDERPTLAPVVIGTRGEGSPARENMPVLGKRTSIFQEKPESQHDPFDEHESNQRLSFLRQAYLKKRDAKRIAKKLWLAHLDHHEDQLRAIEQPEN